MRTPKPNQLYLVALILLCCGPLAAQESVKAVELFDAMNSGQVAVKFIPANAAKANVLIENKTDRVLQVELPDAIAAVPVLAQFDQGFGQNGGAQNGGGQTQGVGGGFNGGNGQGQGNGFGNGGGNQFGQGNQFGAGGGGNGRGMGFMRIAPKKTRKLTARTVCLEHGKPDPNPRIAYRMIPIEEFTDNVKVAELCRQLGRGEIAQKTAQAAAWHFANGLTWEKLAGINRLESRYLGNIKFFQRAELKRAKEFTESLSDPAAETRSEYVSAR
jgi:hypothetical protein